MDLHPKKKIELVTDARVRDEVARLILDCGAKGYTILPGVGGQGSRGIRDSGDIFGVLENVMFIVVASPDVVDRIVQRAMLDLESRPRMVLVSDVHVVRDDHF
jgi:nitrogen regulatory protein PII